VRPAEAPTPPAPCPRFPEEGENPARARAGAGGVAPARDGQSAQADFVSLLRRIHSLCLEPEPIAVMVGRIEMLVPDHARRAHSTGSHHP
jgi:hypothetical protein